MNIVFLAAGIGSRFKKKLENKIFLKINKKQNILDILLENLKKYNFKKKIVILGHNKKKIKNKLLKKKLIIVYNKFFKKKDMLHTLIMGLKFSNDDTIISYTDIIYSKKLINILVKKNEKDIILPVKTDWEKIWKIRGKFNKNDAEALNYDKDLKLKNIGGKINKKTKSQFMGLIFIPKQKIKKIISIYKKVEKRKLQTTVFLNHLIKNKITIKVLPNKEKWYEFDDFEDLVNYKKYVI